MAELLDTVCFIQCEFLPLPDLLSPNLFIFSFPGPWSTRQVFCHCPHDCLGSLHTVDDHHSQLCPQKGFSSLSFRAALTWGRKSAGLHLGLATAEPTCLEAKLALFYSIMCYREEQSYFFYFNLWLPAAFVHVRILFIP